MRSYTTNIGMDSGTHTMITDTRFDNDISHAIANPRWPDHIFVDEAIARAYRTACAPPNPALPVRAINKLWRTLFSRNLFR